MVHNVLSVVWEEHYIAQENAWFIVPIAINIFHSFLFHFYHWQLICRWFQCLIYNDIFLHMYSRVFCLSSKFPWLLGVRDSILFLVWNWHIQLGGFYVILMQISSTALDHGDLRKQRIRHHGRMYRQGSFGSVISLQGRFLGTPRAGVISEPTNWDPGGINDSVFIFLQSLLVSVTQEGNLCIWEHVSS